ncbi:hypothetical protein OFB72_28095, partial [Escherichia coli]|nr:hypothetical protein [Escherichia coli]MCV5231816.1 hypothetical protein [Escherichia coli]
IKNKLVRTERTFAFIEFHRYTTMGQCLILRKKSPAFIEHHRFDFVDLTLPGLEKLRMEKLRMERTSVCIQSIFSLFGSGFLV